MPEARLLAQAITVTTADLQAVTSLGSTITRRTDSVTTSIDIGKPGATSWRFDSLKTNGTFVLLSVPVATSLYAAEFPGATVALQLQNVVAIQIPTIGAVTLKDVVFYSGVGPFYTDQGLRGSVVEFSGAIGRWVRTPGDTSYALPMAMGSTWTSRYKETLRGTLPPLIDLKLEKNHVDTSMVDAWGKMTLPGGTIHDALRIRTIDHVTTLNSDGSNGASTTLISYTFVSGDGSRVKLNAKDTTQADSGMIALPHSINAAIQWDIASIATGVPLASAVPSEFALQQNYPNPFNPSTTIRYSVPERSTVALSVYNLLGQQVAQLVLGDRERGSYEVKFDAGALPSGMYFYRLSAGSFVETRRMMLVK